MRYISTRGAAPSLDFDDVVLTGLARDGGLYVPESWPVLPPAVIRGQATQPYAAVAAAVMAPFAGTGEVGRALSALAADAYAGFGHAATAPLVQLDRRLWLMELFHGPTLAFKDYALQLLGRSFDAVLAKRGERLTIVGATSGDTGSAAIEACRDRELVDVFILHPHGRVSEVQRRQMTTVPSANVFNIAVEGSFDDCQALVKALFDGPRFRDEARLAAVNSINWARIAAQIVYYVAAAAALGAPGRPVAFAVPTGNFGNVYAGYAAHRMGLPVERLVIGTNSNDILDRFFRTGTMQTGAVVPTISPSMDIQVSSNFERLLFELTGRDPAALSGRMRGFRQTGTFAVTPGELAEARRLFASARADDDATRRTIARIRRDSGQLIDPHTAVGIAAAEAALPDGETPVVALACAHPAKFPDAVERACGIRPALPDRLADLLERPERMTVLPNDLGAVEAFIRARSRVTRAAA